MKKTSLDSRKREHKCKWCKKGFSRETTLSSHMCTKKKRFADKDTVGARLGLTVFQRFYELTTTSTKTKTSEDFIQSSYYVEFVKFGRHLADLNPLETEKFVTFVIKNGVKLKDWTKDYVYETYLEDLVNKEQPERAFERTIIFMSEWATANGVQCHDFFRTVTPNEAVFLIKTGKISPWVIYLSDSADALLQQLNSEQYKMIVPMIDPVKWQTKITKSPDDAKFIRQTLKAAGI